MDVGDGRPHDPFVSAGARDLDEMTRDGRSTLTPGCRDRLSVRERGFGSVRATPTPMPHKDVHLPTDDRHFRDSRHCEWRVFERATPNYGGRSHDVLVFDCATSFRCVRTYPGNWRELSAEALEALSWRM